MKKTVICKEGGDSANPASNGDGGCHSACWSTASVSSTHDPSRGRPRSVQTDSVLNEDGGTEVVETKVEQAVTSGLNALSCC